MLLAAVAANGANQFWIHPESRSLKAEIYTGDGLPEGHPARVEFSRLHGVSMTLNLFVFADGVILLLGGTVWWRRKGQRDTAE